MTYDEFQQICEREWVHHIGNVCEISLDQSAHDALKASVTRWVNSSSPIRYVINPVTGVQTRVVIHRNYYVVRRPPPPLPSPDGLYTVYLDQEENVSCCVCVGSCHHVGAHTYCVAHGGNVHVPLSTTPPHPWPPAAPAHAPHKWPRCEHCWSIYLPSVPPRASGPGSDRPYRQCCNCGSLQLFSDEAG